jgi:hypothetical protein
MAFIVTGNYAYIDLNTSGVNIIDISEPTNPNVVATIGTPNYMENLYVDNSKLYMGCVILEIIDISNPSLPDVIGSYDDVFFSHDLVARGNYVYSASCARLCVLDVSDPAHAEMVQDIPFPSELYRIDIDADCLYAIDNGTDELIIFDISDPAAPDVIARYPSEFDLYNIDAYGNFVCMATGEDGMELVNVSDPYHPQRLAVERFIDVYYFQMAGNFIFAIDLNYHRLHVFDITDPADPIHIDMLTGRGVEQLFIGGNYIYLMDWSQNFCVYTYSGLTSINPESPLPESHLIVANYPDPFNAATTVLYELPMGAKVLVEIFDIQGRRIETLFEGWQEAGNHRLQWSAGTNGSGFYFCGITAGPSYQAEKMLLIK